MEDKVIGPLTLVQFFYLLFGGLFIHLLNSWTAGSFWRFLFYPAAAMIAVFAVALAFIKIQERPFIFFLSSLVGYVIRPRRRVWLRGNSVKLVKIVSQQEERKEALPHKQLDRQRVSEIAKVVDRKTIN